MSDSSECTTGVWWFDADSTRRRRARIHIAHGVLSAITDDGKRHDADLRALHISPRLGNAPRRIEFANGVSLSIADNDWLDAVLRGERQGRGAALVHLLESQWRWLAALSVAIIISIYATVTFAIPALAHVVADSLSLTQLSDMSEEMYTQIKSRGLIKDSALSPTQKARADAVFVHVAADYADDGHAYRLQLHRMDFGAAEDGIANAFALPDGLIIATDKLITLLDDEELTAVFAHEIGHIQARHGIRAWLSAAGILAFLTFASGDLSGAAAGGAILLHLKYSRDHEREADCFAFAHLQKHHLPGVLVGSALVKIEQSHTADSPAPAASDNDRATAGDDAINDDGDSWPWRALLEFLSTHPQTENRSDLAAICAVK